ncbi:hypothetical protein M0R72_04445 [Candidatus Pacearchaeota archaeon]|jgi:hypothetical protein|nr:hypothetical protein [Candidatus Pacearchaeota archaeon]
MEDLPLDKLFASFTNLCVNIKGKSPCFDRRRLTNFLLNNKKEFPAILGYIRFEGSPISQFSEEVEQDLFNLQYSKLLSVQAPDLRYYEFDNKMISMYEKISNEERKSLDELAEKMYNEIGCNGK